MKEGVKKSISLILVLTLLVQLLPMVAFGVGDGIISWFSIFTNRIISTMLSTPVEPSLPVISIS